VRAAGGGTNAPTALRRADPHPVPHQAPAAGDDCFTLGCVDGDGRETAAVPKRAATPRPGPATHLPAPPASSFDELSWDAGTPASYFGPASSDDYYVTWGVLDYGGLEWSNVQVKSPSSKQPSSAPASSPPNFAVAWAASPVVALVKAGGIAPRAVTVSLQSFYPFSPLLPPALFVARGRTKAGLVDCGEALLPTVAPGGTQFGPRVRVELSSRCAGADALFFALANRTSYVDSPRPPLESDQFVAFDSLEVCRPKGGDGDGVEVPPAALFLPSPPKDTVNRRRRLLQGPPAPAPAPSRPPGVPPPTPPPRAPARPPPGARCFSQGLDNVTFARTAQSTLAGDYYNAGYNATSDGGGLDWINLDVVSDAAPPPALLSRPNYGRPHWKAAVYAVATKGTFFPRSIAVAAICDARDVGGGERADARCSPPGTPPPAFEVAGRAAGAGGRLRPCAVAALGAAPAVGAGSAAPLTLDLTSCGEVDLLRLRLVPPVYGDQYSFAFDDLRVCAAPGSGVAEGGVVDAAPADGAAWATAPVAPAPKAGGGFAWAPGPARG
jgi:hypothetical protein